MTAKVTSGDPPKAGGSSKLNKTGGKNIASENAEPHVPERDPAAAKASVHEAIGKLIGDDAERRRGTADKEAIGTPGKPRKPPSP